MLPKRAPEYKRGDPVVTASGKRASRSPTKRPIARGSVMTFTATCLHCGQPVLSDSAQIGSPEVRTLQHHLLRRCSSDEVLQDDLAKLLLHYRVAMKD